MRPPRSLWPLGIVLGSLFYIGGVGACAFLACTHKSELVSEKYYDQEIKYQSRIDSLGRAQQLSTRGTAMYNDAARHIVISLPIEHAGKTAGGDIELYRPSAASQDQHFELKPGANGVQMLDTAALPEGLWTIRVTWRVEGREYFFDQKVAIGPPTMQAKLAASAARASGSKP
jgi:nitrogen fixation protein FixH